MGISCCKTEDSVDGRERHNRASKKYEQCDGFGRASIRGSDRRSSFSRRTVQSTFIPPISFDVVIPDKPTRSEHRGHHASFAAFAPLHTAASPVDVDLARTLRDNNPLEMSFTNDFSEVDRDAVQQFVHLVDLRQSMDGASPTPSPRDGALSMEMSSIMWGQGGCARGPSMEHTVQLTAEDIDYINAGASNEEQCARMVQMEEMFRQNLIGLWNMRSTLLQLAARRLVPTLRERRHAGRHALTSSTSGTSDGMRRSASMPPRTGTTRSTNNALPTSSEAWADASPSPVVDNSRGVVLVHAVGMELGSEVWSPLYASSRGNEGATVSFADWDSPANLEGTIHTNLSRHPSNLPSPRSSTLVAMKVEHYELLALTCRDVQVPSKGAKATVVSDTWDFLSMTDSTRILNAGDALFRFMCMPVHEVDEDTLDVLDTFCNVSSFRDEVIENNVPHVNLRNRQDAEKYITIMVKAMYMLPGVKVSDLTPELVSSVAYQKNCQPGSPKIEPTDRSDTFRMQLSIIKFVFSMTIQLKVSEVTDPALLYSFKVADGIVPAKALLLERTKRDKTKSDSTAKVRSLLLYYPVNDGVLVTNQTLVLNTSLPTVASKVLNVMGSKGSSQTAETAQLTRNFLYTKLNLGKR